MYMCPESSRTSPKPVKTESQKKNDQDLVVSQCNVSNCQTDFCDGNNCTQCVPGYYKVGDVCDACYLYCRSCQNSETQCYASVSTICPVDFSVHDNCSVAVCSGNPLKCSRCPDGFYLSNSKCYRCQNPNCKCSSALGCDECLKGFYGLSNFCLLECRSNCLSCVSAVECIECRPGKFGRTCDSDCLTTCPDGTCDTKSGTCLICSSNYYLRLDGKCDACEPRCNSCTSFDTCTSCNRKYYWGSTCQYDCIGCYSTCNRTLGCSSGCYDIKYFRSFNSALHGYECIRCPDSCLACDGTNTCTICNNGYWGRSCHFSCDSCGTTCDKNLGCGFNCSHGYYSVPRDSGYECKPCSARCAECANSSTCSLCNEGYYVNESGLCSPCLDNCKDQNCSRTDGTCIAGCSLGHTGRRCEEECKANCLECDQFDSSICHCCRCVEGFQTTSQTNTGESHLVSNNDKANNGTVIALSAVVGILLIVAIVSITVNIILFRRLKQKTTHPNNAVNNAIISGEVIETNDYQDLNRDRGANTYSSITRDYENTL